MGAISHHDSPFIAVSNAERNDLKDWLRVCFGSWCPSSVAVGLW